MTNPLAFATAMTLSPGSATDTCQFGDTEPKAEVRYEAITFTRIR